MNPNRRRKKRPNYGIRTVEIQRGPNGFGFTISGQQPCILSCIVQNSPAANAGLRAGDFLISINGISVSKMAHDSIVSLIGNCTGPIKMSVADNYYSDSSDDDIECTRSVNTRKPKYAHKSRARVKNDLRRTLVVNKKVVKTSSNNDASHRDLEQQHISKQQIPIKQNTNEPMEYKVIVNYLGTIEMPKELPPNSRLQTVTNCIRKLRQEKTRSTTVLMTILPTCLTLKDTTNHILALYPTNRIVYISSIAQDRESRFFGLVTSAVHNLKKEEQNGVEISNSCHVFMTDQKLIKHDQHLIKAEKFNIKCNVDPVTGNCFEFPTSSLYVVQLIQNLYLLPTAGDEKKIPILANSPQPSASSNSDSGIGNNDCCNVSDRILLVEFPWQKQESNDLNNIKLLPTNPKNDINLNIKSNSDSSDDNTNVTNNVKTGWQHGKSKRTNDAIFKLPSRVNNGNNRKKAGSCDNLDKCYVKLNGGPNDGNGFDLGEKFGGFGSLQNLVDVRKQNVERKCAKNGAQSEPDVRNCQQEMSEQNGVINNKYAGNNEGPALWACSFEKLLDDPLGLQVFAEFLKKEFSAENIYFWTACERFKTLPIGQERINEARRIYQQHLSSGASEAVNVDAQGRQCTEQLLQDPTCNIFEQAQKQIFNLMKFDSYPRFLKSDIYKQCLSGDWEQFLTDSRLFLTAKTPAKLKKSMSNAEDRRRKSLLPWHRKIRSKSKDRDEGGEDEEERKLNSNGSSLTSLDLATSQEIAKNTKKSTDEKITTPLCRVLLSNGSTTVVPIKENETIQDLIKRVLDKRGIYYACFEVFTDKHSKALDVNDSSTKLASCEVQVEQRVVFKVDLPNRKTINIKSKATKIIIDVLRPSLHKYHFNLDQVNVLHENNLIDLLQSVTTINGFRLNVQLKEVCSHDDKNNKLEEITNRVFEGILQEKANSTIFNKNGKSDKGSVKSEDWGSEHSSTFLGKFLRRDSAIHDKKKKYAKQQKEQESTASQNTKKPLIAKWKPGANKLNISSIENDELVEGLTRAQQRRLEDQRGTEINFELPDFLKNKETQNSHFYVSNYENRNITVDPKKRNAPSDTTVTSSSSNQSTPTKNSLNNTVIEKSRLSDPPPLPPKPKIIPIKPTNWGQLNGYNKLKATDRNQAMFLEQPSSSFV